MRSYFFKQPKQVEFKVRGVTKQKKLYVHMLDMIITKISAYEHELNLSENESRLLSGSQIRFSLKRYMQTLFLGILNRAELLIWRKNIYFNSDLFIIFRFFFLMTCLNY